MRQPYLAKVQSSSAASHILRSMNQAISGEPLGGAFGDPQSQVLVIISSDFYVAGLAGPLDAHWSLPGYQPDFCAPGGALVFELRQVKTNGQYLVRVFYTAQTFDQLRNLTPLTLAEPPATMQLLIPNGNVPPPGLGHCEVKPVLLYSRGDDLRPNEQAPSARGFRPNGMRAGQ